MSINTSYLQNYPEHLLYKLLLDGILEKKEGTTDFFLREPGCIKSFMQALHLNTELLKSDGLKQLNLDMLLRTNEIILSHFRWPSIEQYNLGKDRADWLLPKVFQPPKGYVDVNELNHFSVALPGFRPIFYNKDFSVVNERVSLKGAAELMELIHNPEELYEVGDGYSPLTARYPKEELVKLYHDLKNGRIMYRPPANRFTLKKDAKVVNIDDYVNIALEKYNKSIAPLFEEELTPEIQQQALLEILRLAQSLERIHPFNDGNGRSITNMLLILLPMQFGLPPVTWYDPNRLDACSLDQIYSYAITGMIRTDLIVRGHTDPCQTKPPDERVIAETQDFAQLLKTQGEKLPLPELFDYKKLIRNQLDDLYLLQHCLESGMIDVAREISSRCDINNLSRLIVLVEPSLLWYAIKGGVESIKLLFSNNYVASKPEVLKLLQENLKSGHHDIAYELLTYINIEDIISLADPKEPSLLWYTCQNENENGRENSIKLLLLKGYKLTECDLISIFKHEDIIKIICDYAGQTKYTVVDINEEELTASQGIFMDVIAFYNNRLSQLVDSDKKFAQDFQDSTDEFYTKISEDEVLLPVKRFLTEHFQALFKIDKSKRDELLSLFISNLEDAGEKDTVIENISDWLKDDLTPSFITSDKDIPKP